VSSQETLPQNLLGHPERTYTFQRAGTQWVLSYYIITETRNKCIYSAHVGSIWLTTIIAMRIRFLFIAREHTDARYWYSKYVSPSVLYVPVLYVNGLMYCHSFFRYGSPIILVLSASKIFTKFRRGHASPCGDTKYRWGIKITRFWTNNSLYLANDTR